jgi:hypothetical protein
MSIYLLTEFNTSQVVPVYRQEDEHIVVRFVEMSVKEKASIKMSFVIAGLLNSDAVWTCSQMPTFGRNILPPSSALKTAAVRT